MSEIFYVVPEEQHNELVAAAYRHRGYSKQEAEAGARFCAEATRHGIRTHNALKALHLDHLFGSAAGGCVPKAKIEIVKTGYRASQVWNANRKLGQATGYAAIEAAILPKMIVAGFSTVTITSVVVTSIISAHIGR